MSRSSRTIWLDNEICRCLPSRKSEQEFEVTSWSAQPPRMVNIIIIIVIIIIIIISRFINTNYSSIIRDQSSQGDINIRGVACGLLFRNWLLSLSRWDRIPCNGCPLSRLMWKPPQSTRTMPASLSTFLSLSSRLFIISKTFLKMIIFMITVVVSQTADKKTFPPPPSHSHHRHHHCQHQSSLLPPWSWWSVPGPPARLHDRHHYCFHHDHNHDPNHDAQYRALPRM